MPSRLLNDTPDPELINDYSELIKDDLMAALNQLSSPRSGAGSSRRSQRIDEADALAQVRLTASTDSITEGGEGANSDALDP
ncbi:MAG: hypothetical protein IPH55_19760 [Betaproteobacteria bacterium]|nr:hypothetical protein [Betaproteobacteria bacterium]